MLQLKFLKRAGDERRLPKGGEELMAYCAYEDDELLGYCLFRFRDETIELTDLVSDPKDFPIADGLVRAAARFAQDGGKTSVRITGDSSELSELRTSLGVFSDSVFDINAVFGRGVFGCQGCEGCSARE